MNKSVHSAGEFSAILNRERDRSDRTGQEFSMVVFEVGAGGRKSEAARILVPILAQRTRSTDDIGWLEDGRLAVALPHTPTDGAWKFVDHVRQAFDAPTPPPDCLVFSYPTAWIPQGEGERSPKSSESRSAPPAPDSFSHGIRSSRAEGADRGRPIEELETHFLHRMPAWKRAIDIAGSLFALVVLSPLLLLVALLLKVVSPGPLFFRQERIGYLGRVFTLWKFRTMHVNADTAVHRKYLQKLMRDGKEMVKLDNGKDPRIIPFGGILRATGIDELPQLLNVLVGEMSLVGPRPCLPYEAREYQSWQMRRFDAVPGLTGLWQVSGKNRTTFKEMMRLDIGYAKRRTFPLDVKIFLKTIPAIAQQVADRPPYRTPTAWAKGLSTILRVFTVVLAILTLNRFHR